MNEEINSFIDILRLVAAGIVGGLVATFASHKLAAGRDRASAIMAEKKKFIPILETLVNSTKTCQSPDMIVNMFHRMDESHLTFRLHLKGARLSAYDKAWNSLRNTTKEEVQSQYYFSDLDDPRLQKIQNMLISRIEAFRKIVLES